MTRPSTALRETADPGVSKSPGKLKGSDWDSILFVWAVWAALFLLTLRVAAGGRKYPYTDDWRLVPFLVGEQSVTLSWLWEPTGDHRIPLVKVVFVALYNRFTTYDFRVGVVFNVLCLAAIAAGLIWVARHLRGSTAYSDALFPLATLQWGLAAIWWSFGVHYVCWFLLSTAFLVTVLLHERSTSVRHALWLAASVALLPLCGSIGAVLVPALAAWLLLVGSLEWRSANGNRRAAAVMLVGAGAALVTALVSLVGLSTHSGYGTSHPSRILVTALRFTSGEFGRAFAEFRLVPWPYFGPALVVGTAVGLVWAVRGREAEWRRGSGLLFFLASMACLALAIGFGRGGRDWQISAVRDHYAILAVPLLLWSYLVWTLYHGSRPVGRFVEMGLFALIGAVFLLNLGSAHSLGRIREMEDRFEKDVHAGLSAYALAERHRELFWWQDTDEGRSVVGLGLRTLRRAGVPPFRFIAED